MTNAKRILNKLNEVQSKFKFGNGKEYLTDEQISKLNEIKPLMKRIVVGDYSLVDSHSKKHKLDVDFLLREGELVVTVYDNEKRSTHVPFDINKLTDLQSFIEIFRNDSYFKDSQQTSWGLKENDIVAARFQPERCLYVWKNTNYIHLGTLTVFGEGRESQEKKTGTKMVGGFSGFHRSQEVNINTDDQLFNIIQKACPKEVLKYEKVITCSKGDLYKVQVNGWSDTRCYVVKDGKAKALSIKSLLDIMKELSN